jgi:hypothetical protein
LPPACHPNRSSASSGEPVARGWLAGCAPWKAAAAQDFPHPLFCRVHKILAVPAGTRGAIEGEEPWFPRSRSYFRGAIEGEERASCRPGLPRRPSTSPCSGCDPPSTLPIRRPTLRAANACFTLYYATPARRHAGTPTLPVPIDGHPTAHAPTHSQLPSAFSHPYGHALGLPRHVCRSYVSCVPHDPPAGLAHGRGPQPHSYACPPCTCCVPGRSPPSPPSVCSPPNSHPPAATTLPLRPPL